MAHRTRPRPRRTGAPEQSSRRLANVLWPLMHADILGIAVIEPRGWGCEVVAEHHEAS